MAGRRMMGDCEMFRSGSSGCVWTILGGDSWCDESKESGRKARDGEFHLAPLCRKPFARC